MPKRSMPLFADCDLKSAELLAVRDMSSGKLRVLRPLPQRAERPAAEPGPDLALLSALANRKPH